MWVSAALATVPGCTQKSEPPPPLRPVETVVARVGTFAESAAYSGEVRARYENDIAFRIGGKVVERKVDVGTMVNKDAVLARLDPEDAALAAQAARSHVAAATAEYTLAKAELERYRKLVAEKFVSQGVLDAKQSAFDAAQARLRQSRAQASVSRNQSAYTALRAERAGIITAVNVEPGQVVTAGQPVMRLARPGEREVMIDVAEGRVAELREAKRLRVTLWARPDKSYAGRVREIAPAADAATRTFAVRVAIPDADAAVKLGMTAAVALQTDDTARAALLPLTAVFDHEGGAAVWVVDPRSMQVAPRKVTVSAYREDGALVTAGLADGETIVARGVHKLLAGQTVRLFAAAPGSARADAPAPATASAGAQR